MIGKKIKEETTITIQFKMNIIEWNDLMKVAQHAHSVAESVKIKHNLSPVDKDGMIHTLNSFHQALRVGMK